MSLVEGRNIEGKIKHSNKDSYIEKLEKRIAELENTKTKKGKKKFNFDNIIGSVNPSDYPWEF